MVNTNWSSVALERLKDAESASKHRQESIAAPYLAGYAIECALKGYLQRAGIRFPTSGSEGHNLKALWSSANFRLADMNDNDGSKAFYIESWDTGLRYKSSLPEINTSLNTQELVVGAQSLYRWIDQQQRRIRKRSR